MSSKDIAVSVRGLSKSYTIAHNAATHTTAAEALVHRLRHPFQKAEKETFWALKDVEFDIKKGDVVGIIGRNGAGKSTLLKILSRITEPTTGQIDLYGRVGSLLEVGTGFHPELTGRENIFLNGAILGMSKAEIARQFDAIVDFSGTEQFIDTPVKRYSSGMYVRLAFAVAAHLNPEILIVDEVLAVGDTEFQKKCLGKMQDVAHSGRTVLFVSHHMQSVSLLCNKAMMLHKGQVMCMGATHKTLDTYLASMPSTLQDHADSDRRPGSGEYRFTFVQPLKSCFSASEEKCVRFQIERKNDLCNNVFLSAEVKDVHGVVVSQNDSRLVGQWIDTEVAEGILVIRSPWLKPGDYRVTMFILTLGSISDLYEDSCVISVSPVLPYPYATDLNSIEYGVVLSDFDWRILPQEDMLHISQFKTGTT